MGVGGVAGLEQAAQIRADTRAARGFMMEFMVCPHVPGAARIDNGVGVRALLGDENSMRVLSRIQRCSLAATLWLCGCSQLTITRINSAEAKPNNVWVFFTVQHGEEPVAGLRAEDFEIYEDDQLVSKFESQQTIQNPEVAAVMYTLLLLDMSGSVTESGQADALIDAARAFVDKVETSQKVGVYAFDGDKDIKSVVRFTEAKGSMEGGLEGLRQYRAKDPSTNLHGAVVQGLDTLDEALQDDKRPLKFGTLVVFSDGTDRAARVSRDEMQAAIADPKYDAFELYAIGVGAEMEEGVLSEIGIDGTEMAHDGAGVSEAFGKVAQRISDQAKRFYLLSYCSPAREGTHQVRIATEARNERGRTRGHGELEYEFDAKGFGPPPACDPQRNPTFRLDRNLQPLPSDTDARSDGNAKASASVSVRADAP